MRCWKEQRDAHIRDGAPDLMAKSPAKPQPRPATGRNRTRSAKHAAKHAVPLYQREPPETVDPAWLLKAVAACLALAAFCGYITVCVLFATTQWQLVLHPSHKEAHSPAQFGLSAQEVAFAVGSNGQPELHGWWIPAAPSGNDGQPTRTALMLPGGSGTASDDLAQAAELHNAGLNVLLFDYRGFGASTGKHPTQASMQEDSEHALAYLETLRHVPSSAIIPYGTGLGASLAVRLCSEHPALPALILDSADGDFAEQVQQAESARIVPFHLLFHEDFPLATPLTRLPTPKLLISRSGGHPPVIYQRAASPRMLLALPAGAPPDQLAQTVGRFLDSYLEQRSIQPELQ